MKQLLRFIARLYPSQWRQRYEREFSALLDDMNPTWHTAADVLRGGLTMQLRMLTGWKAIAITSLLGGAVALGPSYLIRDRYASSAVIRIDPSSSSNQVAETFVKNVFSDKSLTALIERNGLYPELRSNGSMQEAIVQMKNDVRLFPVQVGDVRHPERPVRGMAMQFRYYDQLLAKRVCDDLIASLMQSEQTRQSVTLELIDVPSTPNSPIYPNRPKFLMTGLLAGMIIGLPIVFLRRSTKPA